MSEQYRGFTVDYQTGAFLVEAVIRDGRGRRLWEIGATGDNADEARQKVHRRIDQLLKEPDSRLK
jgi:hypothetical protein